MESLLLQTLLSKLKQLQQLTAMSAAAAGLSRVAAGAGGTPAVTPGAASVQRGLRTAAAAASTAGSSNMSTVMASQQQHHHHHQQQQHQRLAMHSMAAPYPQRHPAGRPHLPAAAAAAGGAAAATAAAAASQQLACGMQRRWANRGWSPCQPPADVLLGRCRQHALPAP